MQHSLLCKNLTFQLYFDLSFRLDRQLGIITLSIMNGRDQMFLALICATSPGPPIERSASLLTILFAPLCFVNSNVGQTTMQCVLTFNH